VAVIFIILFMCKLKHWRLKSHIYSYDLVSLANFSKRYVERLLEKSRIKPLMIITTTGCSGDGAIALEMNLLYNFDREKKMAAIGTTSGDRHIDLTKTYLFEPEDWDEIEETKTQESKSETKDFKSETKDPRSKIKDASPQRIAELQSKRAESMTQSLCYQEMCIAFASEALRSWSHKVKVFAIVDDGKNLMETALVPIEEPFKNFENDDFWARVCEQASAKDSVENTLGYKIEYTQCSEGIQFSATKPSVGKRQGTWAIDELMPCLLSMCSDAIGTGKSVTKTFGNKDNNEDDYDDYDDYGDYDSYNDDDVLDLNFQDDSDYPYAIVASELNNTVVKTLIQGIADAHDCDLKFVLTAKYGDKGGTLCLEYRKR
jgi:hypothetical protein